jgi:hypothetical protein
MHNTGSYPALVLPTAEMDERDQLDQLLAADANDMALLKLVLCIALATLLIAFAASLGGLSA